MQACFFLLLKGMMIGLSALVPGMAVATTAYLLGCYGQLLQAFASLHPRALRMLLAGNPKGFFAQLDWRTLLCIPVGAALAYWAMPQFLPLAGWIAAFKAPIYAGYCGLVFGGLAFALAASRGGGGIGILLFFGGLALGSALLIIRLPSLPAAWLWMPVQALAAVFGQWIPGLASAFAERPLANISAVQYYADQGYWPAVVLFWAGVVFGIAFLIAMMRFLFRVFEVQTHALLMGLTAAVLLQLWPLRYLQHKSQAELLLVGVSFAGGLALSGLLQFFERRTLA